MFDFIFDQLLQRIIKVEGRNKQFVHFRKFRHACQAVERLRKLLSHGLPAGEEAKISVNFRR
jgi:hypothetical protein